MAINQEGQRMRSGWMRTAALLLALLACDAAAAHAQRVEGRVVDADTDAPVAGARVHLVSEAGDTVRREVSERDGRFLLRTVPAGRYRLVAARIGYGGAAAELELAEGEDLSVTLRMGTRAVAVAPVTVRATPRDSLLESRGFYERREHFGPEGLHEARFLEERDIERVNPFSIADIFQTVPGVHVRGGVLTMRRGCAPAMVVNGFVARGGMAIASPRSIAGIEVYTGTAIPARYLLAANGCGVIVFWTK
jgi:hypothetical protein